MQQVASPDRLPNPPARTHTAALAHDTRTSHIAHCTSHYRDAGRPPDGAQTAPKLLNVWKILKLSLTYDVHHVFCPFLQFTFDVATFLNTSRVWAIRHFYFPSSATRSCLEALFRMYYLVSHSPVATWLASVFSTSHLVTQQVYVYTFGARDVSVSRVRIIRVAFFRCVCVSQSVSRLADCVRAWCL